MRRHRPLTKTELLARMPRAFRPKLDAGQVQALGLLHITSLDAISRGDASPQLMRDWAAAVLTWSRAAELADIGVPEMIVQLNVAHAVLARFQQQGVVCFVGQEYQLAKYGVDVMDQLASVIDLPTAEAAALWSEAEMAKLTIGAPAAANREMQPC